MGADAHVHAVAEPEVAVHDAAGVEALGLGELLLVAVGADQEEDARVARRAWRRPATSVSTARPPDELQRELVAEHLLERASAPPAGSRPARRAGRAGARARSSPPATVFGQRLGATDEERRQLRRDLVVVERSVGAGVGAEVVDEVGRPVAAGRPPLGDQLHEVGVELRVRRLARGTDPGARRGRVRRTCSPNRPAARRPRPGTPAGAPRPARRPATRSRDARRTSRGRRARRAAPVPAHARMARAERPRAAGTDRAAPGAPACARAGRASRTSGAGRGTAVGRWSVVVAEQRLPMEHRAFEDREAVAVGEHRPHVVEARERVGVVLGQGRDPALGAQLAVDGVRVGHHLDGEGIVAGDGRHERRP